MRIYVCAPAYGARMTDSLGVFHHVELWVADFDAAGSRWEWLLGQLGWPRLSSWPGGASWGSESGYLVVEQSPDVRSDAPHDRLRPGVNHVALWAADRATVDRIVATAPAHGWTLLFADRHPHAGGPDHYAAYLEDPDGFEVEVVAGGGAV